MITINNISENEQIEQTNEESSRKTYEAIIEHIKAEIVEGKLIKGQKLAPERQMAKRYGVSRTSIREALRTLEILGVIESVQGSGNFISANIEKSLVESMSMMFLLQQVDSLQISQLREALEIKAALLAVEHITNEEISQLEQIVKEMSISKNERRNVILDKSLHYTIVTASQNTILIQILTVLSELIELHIKGRRSEILSDKRNVTRLQKIHESIVEGIKNRDRNHTYNAMTEHFAIIAEYFQND